MPHRPGTHRTQHVDPRHRVSREVEHYSSHSHGLRDYPEARPSYLTEKFDGPVMGTVIIGRELPEAVDVDDIFELVARDGTSLNPSHVSARNMLKSIEASLSQMSAMPSFENCGSASAAPNGCRSPTLVTAPAAPCPSERHILNEGGFVIFSDLYVQAHPSSLVSAITHDYERAHHVGAEHPFSVDPTLREDEQRVEKIKHLLMEADAYHRPLFRRRPSRLRYGAGCYLPAEAALVSSTNGCDACEAPAGTSTDCGRVADVTSALDTLAVMS